MADYPLTCGRCAKPFERHYISETGPTAETSTYRCEPTGESYYWSEISPRLAELNRIGKEQATGPCFPEWGAGLRYWRPLAALCERCGKSFGSHYPGAPNFDGKTMACAQEGPQQEWLDQVATTVPVAEDIAARPDVVIEFKGQKITGYADGSFIAVEKGVPPVKVGNMVRDTFVERELDDFDLMVCMLEPYER